MDRSRSFNCKRRITPKPLLALRAKQKCFGSTAVVVVDSGSRRQVDCRGALWLKTPVATADTGTVKRRLAGIWASIAGLTATVAVTAVCAAPASASVCVPGAVVAPIQDASYVNSQALGTSYNSTGWWAIGRYKGVAERRAFIQFDLPARPSGCSLLAARLSAPQNTGIAGVATVLAANGPTVVHPVLSPWDASTLTWSHQPKVGRSLATIPAGTKSWNLVAPLRRLYSSGSPTYGISLRPGKIAASRPNGYGWTMLVSKVSTNAPFLTLTWG